MHEAINRQLDEPSMEPCVGGLESFSQLLEW
jgi:hypothetical protein